MNARSTPRPMCARHLLTTLAVALLAVLAAGTSSQQQQQSGDPSPSTAETAQPAEPAEPVPVASCMMLGNGQMEGCTDYTRANLNALGGESAARGLCTMIETEHVQQRWAQTPCPTEGLVGSCVTEIGVLRSYQGTAEQGPSGCARNHGRFIPN